MDEESKQRHQLGKHFILVHGSCLGAWCWYKLAALLTSAGHQVTALDLGASGIHPKQLSELRSFADYSQPLTEVMGSLPEDERVVLVGHSFGGLSLALAMELFPKKIAAAVFLTGIMPSTKIPPDRFRDEFFASIPMERFLDTKFNFGNGPENPPTSLLFGSKFMSTKIYQLCPPEDLTLAGMLVRPSSWFLGDANGSNAMITEDNYGSVRRVFIICKEDQAITEDFQRRLIENSPVTEVMEIEGADHMAMISKPRELCDHLLRVADKYE